MSVGTPYIGSKISLISKAEIRYEGTLYAVDTKESTVTLQKVKSFGTENRPVSKHVPPRSEVYEYIIFRGSDIKDLHVSEVNKQEEQPPDPAILSRSAPVAMQTGTAPNPSVAQFQPIQQQQQPAPSGPAPFPPNPMGAYNPFAMPYFRPPPMMGNLPLPPPHHFPNPQVLPPHPQMYQRPGGVMTNRYLPPQPQQYPPPHFMMHSHHPHMVPWQHQQQPQESTEESLTQVITSHPGGGGGGGGSWQMGVEPPVQVISSHALFPTYPQPQPEEEEGVAGVEEEGEEVEEEIPTTTPQSSFLGGGWPLLLPQHLMAAEHSVQGTPSPQAPVPTWLQPSARGDTPQQSALPLSQSGPQVRQQQHTEAPNKEASPQVPSSALAQGPGKQQVLSVQGSSAGKQAQLQQQPAPSVPPVVPSIASTHPQQSKPSCKESGASITYTSNLSALPASLTSIAVVTTPRPVESAIVKEPATRPAPNNRPAKAAEVNQDLQQRAPKVPLTPKQLQTGQVSPSDNSADPASNGKVTKPIESKEDQQRPSSASRRSHQDQRQTTQLVQSNVEGRGGHKRENHPRGPPRKDAQQQQQQQQQQRVFRYDREFDFESANARFDKENLEEEFKHKAKIADDGRKGDEPEACEEGELEQDGEEEEDAEETDQQSEVIYDKKKSFFDSMSCDTNKTGGNLHAGRHEERALNTETFGVSTVHGYRYRSRGGRGRGGGGGGSGYYRSRGRRGGGGGRPRVGAGKDGETLTDGGGGGGNGYGNGRGGGGGHYSDRHSRDRQNRSREYPQGQRRWNNREQVNHPQPPPPPQLEKN